MWVCSCIIESKYVVAGLSLSKILPLPQVFHLVSLCWEVSTSRVILCLDVLLLLSISNRIPNTFNRRNWDKNTNLSNTMAVTTQLRVSYLTNSLPRRNSWTSTYQSRILSLKNSNSRIMHSKLSIKSIAFNDKVAFSNLSHPLFS